MKYLTQSPDLYLSMMPSGPKSKKKKGGGRRDKNYQPVKSRSTPNAAGESRTVDDDTLTDKLNEALILDESTEIVLVCNSNNNNEKNIKTPVSSKAEIDSSLADSSNFSPDVNEFIPAQTLSKSHGDTSPVNNDPFEVSYSSLIFNNSSSSFNRSSNKSPEQMMMRSFNKTRDDLVLQPRTIEEFVSLGVPREIAVMKHPLEHSWSFWYFMNDKTKTRSWEECQFMLYTVDTIEDFWRVYNHIEPASKIEQGCDYALFKVHIVFLYLRLILIPLV